MNFAAAFLAFLGPRLGRTTRLGAKAPDARSGRLRRLLVRRSSVRISWIVAMALITASSVEAASAGAWPSNSDPTCGKYDCGFAPRINCVVIAATFSLSHAPTRIGRALPRKITIRLKVKVRHNWGKKMARLRQNRGASPLVTFSSEFYLASKAGQPATNRMHRHIDQARTDPHARPDRLLHTGKRQPCRRISATERMSAAWSCLRKWQGHRDSNPGPTVLETVALPTELYPYRGAGLSHLWPGIKRAIACFCGWTVKKQSARLPQAAPAPRTCQTGGSIRLPALCECRHAQGLWTSIVPHPRETYFATRTLI